MERLARYTVEIRPPESGWHELQQATARARQAADQLQSEGGRVRFLRSVFVPEDGACFFLYEGPSAQSVRAAAARAELDVVRVDVALRLDPKGEERT